MSTTAFIFDIDEVIRDLVSMLLRECKSCDKQLPVKKQVLEALASFDGRTLRRLFASADTLPGAAALLKELELTKPPGTHVYIVSASGFSWDSTVGTMDFLRRNGIVADLIHLSRGSDDKVKYILDVASGYNKCIVFDDYKGKVLDKMPDSFIKYWVKRPYNDEEPDDSVRVISGLDELGYKDLLSLYEE